MTGAVTAPKTEGAAPRGIGAALGRLHIAPRWRLPLFVYSWVQLVLLGWWAAQWPGLLSPDSIRYIVHVTTGPWTADHSVLYDFLVLCSLNLTHNVALLTLAQTIAAAVILAFGVCAVREFGVRPWWAATPALIMPCVPSFGAFVSTVWKDVPFALTEILLAVTTVRLISRRRRPNGASQQWLLVSIGVEFAGLALFRNDGFLMVVITAIVLVVLLRGVRFKIAGAAVAALAVFVVAEVVIYPAVGIKPASSSLAYGTFYGDIAVAYAEEPSVFTTQDRALLATVAPLGTWRHASDCYTSDPLFGPSFDAGRAAQLKHELAALWFRTLARAPVLIVRTRLCRSAIAWNPFPPPAGRAPVIELVRTVPSTLYSIGDLVPPDIARSVQSRPLSKGLARLSLALRRAGYDQQVVQDLFFRGALWCYVLYLGLIVASRRLKRWDVFAVGAMSLANQLTVIAANPAQLYRYVVGPILIGMLLVPLASARPTRSDIEDEQGTRHSNDASNPALEA